MSSRAKSINLFLMDGSPKGRVKCTLANWTGVAYKIPRTMLEQARQIGHLNQTGVYILFSGRQADAGELAYIGQSGLRRNGQGILSRLFEHRADSDKDYWNEAVVLTTSNNSFGPTEISYLENRFYMLAQEARRYEVKNSNIPSSGHVTEEKESELEDFIEYARLVVGSLGYDIFDPLLPEEPESQQGAASSDAFEYFMAGKNYNARGRQIAEGFVVLKGSRISSDVSRSAPPIVQRARSGRAESISLEFELLDNFKFTSPSSAASFVAGSGRNGKITWKKADGQTLGQAEAYSQEDTSSLE